MPTNVEFAFKNQIDHLRKDMASMSTELEDAESHNHKLKRELNDALMEMSRMTSENARLKKVQKRIQFDFEEAVGALAQERQLIMDQENKLKKLGKAVDAANSAVRDVQDERDEAVAKARQIQSKVEGAEDKARAAERKIADVEDDRRTTANQLVGMTEKKNRAEKLSDELEHANAGLDSRLADTKAQISELASENKSLEGELRGMDLTLSTVKAMASAEAAKNEEKISELEAQLSKATRVLQTTEGELANAISGAAAAKRLAENQIAALTADAENLKRDNTELLSNINRLKEERAPWLPKVVGRKTDASGFVARIYEKQPEIVFDDEDY